jgi:hypothetical protein
MLLAFVQWLQETEFFTYLRGSSYTYPVVLSLHMVVILFFGGMILMTDMRLLGLAMTNQPISDVVNRLRVPKRYGLIAMISLGLLLFGCKAEEYYYNTWFRTKLILLLLVGIHYLAFRSSIYDNATSLDRLPSPPGRVKLGACLSIVLWASIICAGRGIGYIEPPLDKIHANMWSPGRRVTRPYQRKVTGNANARVRSSDESTQPE